MNRILYDSINRITQEYSGSHKGIDLGWNTKYTREQNFDVYANCVGEVSNIRIGLFNMPNSVGIDSWGNYVEVLHPNGMKSRYAHLSSVCVGVGQKVDENTKIGVMGDSGNAKGVHLHFEVYDTLDMRINPIKYLTEPIYKEQNPVEIPNKKTTEEIAKEVIQGLWGNGQDRKNRLESAGYNYNEVQNLVNQMLGGSSPNKKGIEEIAKEVIQGLWGNGQDRKNRLENAGYNYNEVQNLVNQMLGY